MDTALSPARSSGWGTGSVSCLCHAPWAAGTVCGEQQRSWRGGQQLLPQFSAWALFLCQRWVFGQHPGSLRSHSTGDVMCPGWAVTGSAGTRMDECCMCVCCGAQAVHPTVAQLHPQSDTGAYPGFLQPRCCLVPMGLTLCWELGPAWPSQPHDLLLSPRHPVPGV